MYRRKRWALPALVAIPLAIAACGGPSSHQHKYTVPLPSGKTVVQAHSPAIAAPKPGTRLPAAVAPVNPSPSKVSHQAKRIAPRIAGSHPKSGGDPAISTIEQFDSVTVGTVPRGALAVAGYTSGFWPTYNPLVAAFPRAYHTSIAVNSGHAAQCLDREPGDATASQAGWWVNWELRNGWVKPCVYASISDMPDVVRAISSYGVVRSRYFLWDANWTYYAHLDSGYDCTQWTDHAYNLNLDESTCTLPFLRHTSVPPKPPGPSHAQVSGWISIRGKSLHAYYVHRCRRPVLTSGTCGQLAWRVDHFQKLVDTNHGYYPRCFGKHANRGAAECQIVRPAVAVWTGAVKSSHGAYFAKHCVPPSSRGVCGVFRHEESYFQGRINRTLATSRY